MKFLSLLSLCALFLSGCGVVSGGKAWSSIDSWYHPQSHKITSNPYSGKGGTRQLKFVEVSGAFEPQAENLLRSKSAAPIPLTQAKLMTAGKYRHRAGKPYLVRAVYLNKETGNFTVVSQGQDLFVNHASIGSPPFPMTRQVLIVDLTAPPRHVYVNCSLAE